MIVIGIDPGLQGGLAIFNAQDQSLGSLLAMPDTLRDFAAIFEVAKMREAYVAIERAQSMPKQGIVSAFNYGRHFGELIGVVTALAIPYMLVPATSWTKVMHASTKKGTPKQKSLEAAQRLFPKANFLATERSKKPHEGLVDAALIAAYAARQLGRPV